MRLLSFAATHIPARAGVEIAANNPGSLGRQVLWLGASIGTAMTRCVEPIVPERPNILHEPQPTSRTSKHLKRYWLVWDLALPCHRSNAQRAVMAGASYLWLY
jgi:hypothetical protein